MFVCETESRDPSTEFSLLKINKHTKYLLPTEPFTSFVHKYCRFVRKVWGATTTSFQNRSVSRNKCILHFNEQSLCFSSMSQLLPTEAQRRQLFARSSHMSPVTSGWGTLNQPWLWDWQTLLTWDTLDLRCTLLLFIIGEKKGQGRRYESGGGLGLCVDPRVLEISLSLGCAAQL